MSGPSMNTRHDAHRCGTGKTKRSDRHDRDHRKHEATGHRGNPTTFAKSGRGAHNWGGLGDELGVEPLDQFDDGSQVLQNQKLASAARSQPFTDMGTSILHQPVRHDNDTHVVTNNHAQGRVMKEIDAADIASTGAMHDPTKESHLEIRK